MVVSASARAHDHRDDRRTLLVTSGLTASVYALGAAAQTRYVYTQLLPELGAVPITARLAANGAAVVGMLVLLVAFRVAGRPLGLGLVVRVLVLCLAAAFLRTIGQVLFGVYDAEVRSTLAAELVTGGIIVLVSCVFGIAAEHGQRRLRDQVRRASSRESEVQAALAALAGEEVRVRRAVAEGLHGSLQQRLVLVTARLDRILQHVREGTTGPEDRESLVAVRAEIESVREGDVREMSRLLYPDQLEIGLVPAVRALLRNLPRSIATNLGVSDAVRAIDDPTAPVLTEAERLLVVRIVEEAVTNALRHGGASSIAVSLDIEDRDLVVVVEDDGSGFDGSAAESQPSGTARLRGRLELVGGSLALASRLGAGTRVMAQLPVSHLHHT